MATCNANKVKEAYQKSKDRAETLSKIMKSTKEGEVLSVTIANADKALELVKQKKMAEVGSVDRSGLIANPVVMEIRKHLSDVFLGAVGNNVDSSSERTEFVLKGARYENKQYKVDVSPIGQEEIFTYTFDKNANVSGLSPLAQNRLFIPEFNKVTNAAFSKLQDKTNGKTKQDAAREANKSNKELFSTLYNEELGTSSVTSNKFFDYNKASLNKNYTHGQVEDMRNLLADLHAIKDNTVTDEIFDRYNDLLDQMHPKFFRDMSLYINENANHTQGWVVQNKKHILLNTSSNTSSDMTNEEMYMHETIHTMTTWGLQNADADLVDPLKNKLHYLKEKAADSISWKDIFKADPNLQGQAGEDFAKARYDYIFNSRHSDDEFLAFFLTNPVLLKLGDKVKLSKKEAKGFIESVKELFGNLMDIVMGNFSFANRNKNLNDEIHALAFKLAEINAEGTKEVKDGGLFSKAGKMVGNLIEDSDAAVEEFVSKVPKLLDTEGALEVPENMNLAEKVMFRTKFFSKAIYNKKYRDAAGLYASSHGIKANSTARNILRNLLPELDIDNKPVEWLGLQNNKIDMGRNSDAALVANSVANSFSKGLIDTEQNALTRVLLESNASTLFMDKKSNGSEYSTQKIQRILSDRTYRNNIAKRISNRIKKEYKSRSGWLIGQAEGLGYFMSTGIGHEAQNTNSVNIAKGFLTTEHHKYDETLVKLVEELSVLNALDHNNQKENDITAELLGNEAKGVMNVVELYEAFKAQSKESLFKKDSSHLMDGYIRELFDESIDVVHEPLEKADELEKKGYKLIKKLANNGLAKGKDIGVFISDSHTKGERLRGAVILGNPHSRGLTLKDVRYKQFEDSKKHAHSYFENDLIRLSDKTNSINKELDKGSIDVTSIEPGLIPILDAYGNIVNYRGMMTKKDKELYLGQEKGIVEVLSKSSSTLISKLTKENQNKAVLDYIKKDLKERYDNPRANNNLEEYTLVSSKHSNPEIRRIFHMMPLSFQKFANERADQSLPVPAILMDQYFGYSHYRFTDTYGVNKLPTIIKRILNIAEEFWQDLVKIAKGNILLKMPVVLAGNIISNIVYAINTHTNPFELVSMYTTSFRNVKAYMKMHKDMEKLKVEYRALTQHYHTTKFTPTELSDYNDSVKRMNDKIKRLKTDMKKNDTHELFELGMYQAVIEDVNMYKLGDTNKISDGMDKLLEHVPSTIKTPAQWFYLSKETAWYKISQDFLQLSDLVARDVMNRKMKKIEKEQANGDRNLPLWYRENLPEGHKKRKRLEKGTKADFYKQAEKYRHNMILDSFVNYTLPNGKGEEYLNRMGILMFTKYFKNIQRVVTRTTMSRPIRTTLTLAAAAAFLNADNIHDQSLFYKAYDDNDNGIGGIVPWYSPLDILTRVVNPPLIDLAMNPTG